MKELDLSKFSETELTDALADTRQKISRMILSLLGFELFCIVALASPDSLLLGEGSQLSVPFAGRLSFKAFLIIGPAILISIRLYIHIYIKHWTQLDNELAQRAVKIAPVVSHLRHPLLRWPSVLLLYGSIPPLIFWFAWKALPIPIWGTSLSVVSVLSFLLHLWCLASGELNLTISLRRIAYSIATAGFALILLFQIISEHGLTRPLNLVRANLSGMGLADVSLEDADLSGANLTGANLIRAALQGARLTGVILENAVLVNANLTQANLKGAIFRKANLTAAIFGAADLEGVDFSGATIRNADLSQTRLSDANLSGVNLSHSRLEQVMLNNADLRAAILYKVNLTQAILDGTNFENAYLRKAVLNDTNLKSVNFRNSDLSFATLQGADLSEADLRDADLYGTDLRGVKGIECDDLHLANNWTKSIRDDTLNCESANSREAGG